MAIPATSAAALIKSLLLIGTVPFGCSPSAECFGEWKTTEVERGSEPAT
jgi:hypothetical protein